MRWSAAVIGGIVLLVCMVSLPRLEDYVRSSNEEDARIALRVLGTTEGLGEVSSLPTWIAESRGLRHRFRDARVMEDSGLLMHHGYLFALERDASGTTRVVAWPRSAPRTGRAAFLIEQGGQVRRHPNPWGRWSGAALRPENLDQLGGESAWRPAPER